MSRRPAGSGVTDVDALPFPAAAREALTTPRQQTVVCQSAIVPVEWWNRALNDLNLPGGPLYAPGHQHGTAVLTREDVWHHASGAGADPRRRCGCSGIRSPGGPVTGCG